MTKKDKSKYKGDFNISGQCFTLYCHAYNLDSAFRIFIHKLNRQTGISKFQLLGRFKYGGIDNHYIQKV